MARSTRKAPIHPNWLSRLESAAYLGIAPTTFDKHVRVHVVESVAVGDARWSREELDQFMSSRKLCDDPLADE